jgi:ParB family transcriptional regulator, chromosome partitioning protein
MDSAATTPTVNPSSVLKDAASAYKVDTDAIAIKVRQEFTAKEKARKAPHAAAKQTKKSYINHPHQ